MVERARSPLRAVDEEVVERAREPARLSEHDGGTVVRGINGAVQYEGTHAVWEERRVHRPQIRSVRLTEVREPAIAQRGAEPLEVARTVQGRNVRQQRRV